MIIKLIKYFKAKSLNHLILIFIIFGISGSLTLILSEPIINFIKINEIVEYMNSVAYEFNNTVGPKSISKGEFIVELNKCIQKLVNSR